LFLFPVQNGEMCIAVIPIGIDHKLPHFFFEVCHPRCVSNKSNYKEYAYVVKHNYVLGGMLFAICKAQLHVSAINVGQLQVVQ